MSDEQTPNTPPTPPTPPEQPAPQTPPPPADPATQPYTQPQNQPAPRAGSAFVSGAQTFARQRPIVAGILALITVCLVCAICGGVVRAISGGGASTASGPGGSTATHAPAGPTATHAPTATATPSYAHFDDGTFEVGKDIQPGTYRTRTGSPGCYWARLSGFDGTLGEIIANDNTDYPAVVTIATSDKGFQSQGCGEWTQDLSQITQSKTSFPDGTYIVGTDMDPGTYRSTGQQGCYWARLSNFGGGLDGIITNDNTDTAAIVTIQPGDKGFQSNGCGTWTKE